MMMIDYKALAERVAQRAIYADNNADQNNKTWAADLRTVVSLLNGMAGQKPFAWAIRDGWSQTRFSVDPDTPILGTRRADYVVDALYLHPAPAAPHGDASRMIDALQSIRAHVEHDPSALAAAIVATCDSVLDAAPQAEPLTDGRITKGEYVFATKWDDGDPGDHWGVGFYDRFANGRHYVVDSAGKQIRGNGFRRVGRITVDVGRWLLSAGKSLEASPPGTVNLWTMLTERARRIGGNDGN